MIIWGTTHLKSKIDTGVFHCPQCQSENQYTLKKYTEYFTLYFIPLIPMGSRGKFVECSGCRGSFAEAILSFDPDAEMVENHTAVFRLLVAFMVHFHKTGEPHVAACQHVYSNLIEQEVPVEIVESELAMAMQPDSSPDKFIRLQGPTFAGEAKLHLLASARNIVTAETVDEDHVQGILLDFAALLGISKVEYEQIQQVINELAQLQMQESEA